MIGLLIAAMIVLSAAAPAAEAPRPAPRRLAGGGVVQPDAVCRWSDLLQIDLIEGRLEVYGKAPAEVAGFIRNRRAVHLQIGDSSDAVWLVQGLPPVLPPQPGQSGGPLYFLASPRHREPADIDNVPVSPLRVTVRPGQFHLATRFFDEKGRATLVEFRTHSERGEMTLSVRESSRGRMDEPPPARPVQLTAHDVGELSSREPAAVRTYLRPLLSMLTDGRDPLRPRAGDIYRAFETIVPDAVAVEEVERLVEQFDALDPAVRQSASARLESLGRPGVLAAVRFDRAGLSPEQRSRLDGFIARHALRRGDGRLADPSLLRRDLAFLIDCLEDQDNAVRQAALQALRLQTGKPIDFDLDAPPAVRHTAASVLAKTLLPAAD